MHLRGATFQWGGATFQEGCGGGCVIRCVVRPTKMNLSSCVINQKKLCGGGKGREGLKEGRGKGKWEEISCERRTLRTGHSEHLRMKSRG